MGQAGCKTIMESQEVDNQETEMDEKSNCTLLAAVLDGTTCHVVSDFKERSGCQSMTALKNGLV